MRTAVFVAALAVLGAHPAAAQDEPRFGLTMAYPSSVGVIWRASERIAVRPDVAFAHSHSESTTTIVLAIPGIPSNVQTTTSDADQVTVGVSALVYVATHEALRTYVAPRAAYLRNSNSFVAVSTLSPSANTGGTSVTSGYQLSGTIGAQYLLGSRFAIFGETGLAYQRTTPSSTPPAVSSIVEQKATSIGMRSGVGVVLYFR